VGLLCLAIVAGGGAAAQAAAVPARAGQVTKVSPEMEAAVERGLDYFARTQTKDGPTRGSWGNQQYGQVSGVVGMVIMAMLAHGEVPDDSKYGRVLKNAIDYIVTTQESNGLLGGHDGGSPMYSHGFATLALAEVYGMSDNPRVGPALKKAVGLIVSTQNRLGGWRYTVGATDADTTVSGAQMLALRAAANAGIEVPEDTIRRGVAFYKSMFCPGGGFGYTDPVGPSRARSGIGLLILSLSGQYRSPETKATADFLAAGGARDTGYFMYSCYYCSQAMFQAGGRYWREWNDMMTPLLIRTQKADGTWDDTNDSGGVIAGTAMALLAIEINYNLLPIYQR
jgi:hypothetical protein